MTVYYTIQSLGAMRRCLHMVPEGAGVYMMVLDRPDILNCALNEVGLRLDPLRLGVRPVLYIGTTNSGMRSHLSRHLAPRSSGSAFRMGVGAVLSHHLGLMVAEDEAGPGFNFAPDSEKLLSDWLDTHVSIAMRVVGVGDDPVVAGAGYANGESKLDPATFETKGLLVHADPRK